MCEIYAGVDQQQYQKTTKSLRLHGHVTSLALENRFWFLLSQMAEAEDVTLVQFVTTLHDEVLTRRGEVRNFASLLRVACTTFLLNQVETGSNSARTKVEIATEMENETP